MNGPSLLSKALKCATEETGAAVKWLICNSSGNNHCLLRQKEPECAESLVYAYYMVFSSKQQKLQEPIHFILPLHQIIIIIIYHILF